MKKCQDDVRAKRLVAVIKRLAAEGVAQTQVAASIGIAPQYLNDLLHQRRPIGELVARRLAERYKFDFRWLLGKESGRRSRGSGPAGLRGTDWLLPVLPRPVECEPQAHPKWDGNFVHVPAVAGPSLASAKDPYVLRFAHGDIEGRLHRHDLVLVSQDINERAEICVVRTGRKCFLARHKKGSWIRVANGDELGSDCVVVGHCVGVVWSELT